SCRSNARTAPTHDCKLGLEPDPSFTSGAGTPFGSLDRRLDLDPTSSPRVGRARRTAMVSAEEEHHDYAEIYTPSRELADFEGCPRSGGRPPTPPLHRFPSWESRIYEVAVNGITQSLNPLPSVTVKQTSCLREASRFNTHFPKTNVQPTAISKAKFSIPANASSSLRDSSSADRNFWSRVMCSKASAAVTIGSGVSLSSSSSSLLLLHCAGITSCTMSSNESSRQAHTLSSRLAYSASSAFTLCASRPESMTPVSFAKASSAGIASPRCTGARKEAHSTGLREQKSTNAFLRRFQGDTARKPRGQITLDDVCRVTRSEGAATFEIATGKRSFYLSAESTSTMEEWVKVLQCVLRRNATRLLLSKEDHKPAIDGWLTKVKHGHSRRCWCSLIGRTFLYFKTPNDMTPLGQISMREVRVEEVVHVSDSDEEGSGREGPVVRSEYTVGIFPPHQSPTYLLMASKQELDTWLYHLTVVSSGDSVVGTQYEQLMSKLMEVDGDENSVVWRHPLLLHTKESIAQPLTTLPSEALQTEAVKLFKSIQLFISVPLDASGIDYHVALAQNALAQCLGQPELQNELFCQLIKQTSRHSYHKLGVQQLLLCATQSLFLCDTASGSSGDKGSPTSQRAPSPEKGGSPKGPAEGKQNPPPFVLIQGWQLLALAVSLFPPRNRTLWYLRAHLQRNADTK
ncbi:unnamed protein product, partial [Ixodes pacificus]